jgi:hypothetical protein
VSFEDDILVAEDWSIDTLRAPEREGSMTVVIWEAMAFDWALAKLQARISLFKRGMLNVMGGASGASGGDTTFRRRVLDN